MALVLMSCILFITRSYVIVYLETLRYQKMTKPSRCYSQKNWVEVRGPLPKTPTLFMTKAAEKP